jgi:cardiolipin synthase
LAGVAVIPLIILALVGLPHVVREPMIESVVVGNGGRSRIEPGGRRFGETTQLLTGTPVDAGTRIEILTNGNATFPRLWRDLRDAQRSITVQMYYAKSGFVVDTTFALLAAASRRGVDVYFLYDGFGAGGLTGESIDAMRIAGVHTALFRPIKWYALDRANHRSHVRGVVVDGRVGYTGGFGLDDKWLGDGRSAAEWRETNVRFAGPAARQLQSVFVAKWSEATGRLLADDRLFPSDATPPLLDSVSGGTALLHSPPGSGSTVMERLLALTISGARHRLYITNAYFIPQRGLSQLMVAAARRGVDVRVLTNGSATDVASTRFAAHRQYAALLAAGVRIWEYKPTTVHAKTFVADGVWSSIMTANFDNRSIAYNDEVALVVQGAEIGAKMDSLFLGDLRFATEVREIDFRRRPLPMKLAEWFAGLIARIL